MLRLSEITEERIKDMERGKRLLAILLSVIMITVYMPAAAFAAAEDGSDAEETVTEESREAAPEEDPAEETGDDEADDVSEAEPAAAEEEKKEEVKADEEASEPEPQQEEPQEQDAPALSEGSVVSVEAEPDVDIADSDELLWDYMNKELAEETGAAGKPGMQPRSHSRPRGAQLTGIDRMIYDSLKNKINYLVDPDEGDDVNSTCFRVTFAELLGKEYPLVTKYGETTSMVPREDASQFIDFDAGEFLFDYNKITDALLSDLPYALYWYDKTKGISISLDPSYYPDDNYFYFCVGDSGNDPGLLFKFRVSADYSQSGETGTFELNRDKRDRARTAVNTANDIISSISGGGNYEILAMFKDRICELVKYDDDAVADSNTPYGDPWQMINIFDNDPGTDTVCEGYSKAFQYLVDNTSQLSANGIECDSVTGTMNGGSGAGRHMWNILRMDDGKNYLADITNCDEGTVGNPDGLFIKECEEGGSAAEGYTCKINNTNYSIRYVYDDDTTGQFSTEELTISDTPYHSLVHVPAEKATCLKTGHTDYWKCELCGELFADPEGVTGITQEELVLPVDPDAHEWSFFVIISRATADEEGEMRFICKYDESHTKNIPIAKLDPETSGPNDVVSSVNDADKAASALNGSSATSTAIQEAEDAANYAYSKAEAAVEAAQAALTAAEDKTESEYASALQAAGDADVILKKANAVIEKVAVKKAVKKAAVSKAVAASATKGTKTAVTKAETALADAKAATSAAARLVSAAVKVVTAVQNAGYGEDSDEYRAAAQALEEARNEKAAVDNAVTAAETAVTKAQSSYDAAVAAEKKRQGKYNKVIPQVKGVKLSSKKTSITVKWTKLTSSQIKKSKVAKYEIWLCPDTEFGKSNTTIKTVTKSYSTKAFTKLKKGKKYYVKVRAIKYVKGVKNVGKWSSRKYIKTKK